MNKLYSCFIFLLCVIACKKETVDIRTTGSINVINTVVDLGPIKVNPTGNSSAIITDSVVFAAAKFYYAPTGPANINVVAKRDTTRILVNDTYNLESAVYTMYITGTTTAVDTMFRKETNFPFIKTDVTAPPSSDSVVNVRFVNLSPNSVPVKIKISGAATNEVDNLPYKGISEWKMYAAKLTTTAYFFQVRDAVTDVLLLSYTFNATGSNRFKNVALVIKGLQGTTTGTNAFGFFVVNYF